MPDWHAVVMRKGSAEEPLAALRHALDDLTSRDLDRLFDDQIETAVVELHALGDRLEAAWLRHVEELDRRGIALLAGYRTATSWLADRCRLAWRQARGAVGRARSLAVMPATATAFAMGVVGTAAVRRLVAARNRHPEHFAEMEATLLDAAMTLPDDDLRKTIDYWSQAIDHRGAADDARASYARRHLHVSPTFDGTVRVDGELDPESGSVVVTFFRSLPANWTLDSADDRTPAQLRADAFVDLCRDALDHGDLPVSGGERPHLTVTVDLAALESRAGHLCEIDPGGVITPESARRLACDAGVARIITRGPSEVVDVGRRTRTVPSATRRALVARDGGCAWDGCDRPARWCDAHHIVHWIDGGPTDLANLQLLCRHHHRQAHELERAPPGG